MFHRIITVFLALLCLVSFAACGTDSGVTSSAVSSVDSAWGVSSKEGESASSQNSSKGQGSDAVSQEGGLASSAASQAHSGVKSSLPSASGQVASSATSAASQAVSSIAPPASSVPVQNQLTVSMTILGPKGEVMLAKTSLTAKEGASVFDVLRSYAVANQLPLEYSGGTASAYVKGIGDYYERDYGGSSGWLYRVNNDFSKCSFSSSKYLLKNGDSIEWLYTCDGGKDVGAK